MGERERIAREFIEVFINEKLPYQYWDGKTIQAELTDIIHALERLDYRRIDTSKLTPLTDKEDRSGR